MKGVVEVVGVMEIVPNRQKYEKYKKRYKILQISDYDCAKAVQAPRCCFLIILSLCEALQHQPRQYRVT